MPEENNKPVYDIEGTLERFVYHNEENGWSVIRLTAKRRQAVTAVGILNAVQPGESLKLSGRWVQNKQYGPEFHFDTCLNILPNTLTGIEKYLGSGMIHGIGKEMAKRMVKAFGINVIDVIENHPKRLMRVNGIGEHRLKCITEGWQKHKDIKEVMIFLQSLDISPAYAAKIYRTYGNDSIKVVREEPYRIATDVWGIGFKIADKIAEKLGIGHDSPKRAMAGMLYVLGQLSEKGHVCYPVVGLIDLAKDELQISETILKEALNNLVREGLAVVESRDDKSYAYLKSLYVSETGVKRLFETFIGFPQKKIPIDIAKAVAWFEAGHKMELAPEQCDAIASAVNEKAMIITGGPGTGETTIIRSIIEILEKKGLAIQLAAPTGRAAKRMFEATRRTSKTIHRLLEFNPASMQFERNQEKPLKTDLLILDEVSMVDIVLFYHIMKALPASAKLILVGDADQLPSVGPGNVLNDLIGSMRIKTVHLTKIFRQARQSLIVVNAHRVNNGEMPYPSSSYGRNDYEFIKKEDATEALNDIKQLVTERLPSRFGFDPVNDIQVLTPMHKGVLGVFSLNLTLQAVLNPQGEGISRSGYRFCKGDKIMQVRNNYDLGIFNGDIGRITAIETETGEIEADFDGRIVPLMTADLDDITLAYACSIHKAQGSEYPAVIIAMHTQHYVMLQRNLLYTAITRGRKFVAVVGSARAVALAVKNANTGSRLSLLKERLNSPAR
jgi:exodeoxyribonuclease V alpha subunit